MKSIIILSCFALCGAFQVNAQSSQNSGGSTASSSAGNVSYSIGQTFYESVVSSGGNTMPGVQHSYEITETLGQEISEIGLGLKIYPNPTTDILNLKVDLSDYQKYSYELYDFAGKIFARKSITSKLSELSIAHYPSAVYLLKVLKNNKPVKIFKVVKTDK